MTQDDYARNNVRGRCLQTTEPNWASLNLIGLYWAESGNDTEDDSDGPDSSKHSATKVQMATVLVMPKRVSITTIFF